jgi:hypothetical protein
VRRRGVFYFTADDGRDPIVFEEETHMSKLLAKAAALYAWSRTPAGKTTVHRIVTGALAAYTALHRAGV